jgi:hypothetical protein
LDVMDIQETPVGYPVVDFWVKRLHFVSIVAHLQWGSFAPQALPWLPTLRVALRAAGSRLSPFGRLRSGSQVPRLLFPCALSPVTPRSPSAAFKSLLTDGGRLRPIRKIGHSLLCNEAESSSLALRLAGSLCRAPVWGFLLSPPTWLHVGHFFHMLITFQINKEVRLGLTHRKPRSMRMMGNPSLSLIG